MRLSKKLLAALLPITATSALVPVLTSCNKGSSFNLAYGTSINCIGKTYETVAKYISIGTIRTGVKNHIAIASDRELTLSQLPKWSDNELNKQIMYYDFIASHVFSMVIGTETRAAIQIALDWNFDEAESKYTISLYLKDETAIEEADSLQYSYENGVAFINMYKSGASVYKIKSYNFQNTKITGA